MAMLTDKGYMEDGLSEDGKTFTTLVATDEEGIKPDGNTGDANDNMTVDEMANVDVNALPPEHRESFIKMKEKLTGSMAELNALRGRADATEKIALELAQRKPASDGDGQPKPKIEKVADSLKFEDNDYYAPFFKAIAGAIDKIGEQIATEKISTQQNTVNEIKRNAKKFLDEQKLDTRVVHKMDQIAGEFGGQLYGDMPRLLKLAKAELGIVDTPKPNNVPRKTPNPSRTVESGTFRRSQGEPKKIGSMQDAFKKAEEDLTQKGD